VTLGISFLALELMKVAGSFYTCCNKKGGSPGEIPPVDKNMGKGRLGYVKLSYREWSYNSYNSGCPIVPHHFAATFNRAY